MYNQGPRRTVRHPGKMPGAMKLNECVEDLKNLCRRMTVTDRDRATPAWFRMSQLIAGMSFYNPADREPYLQNLYLGEAAQRVVEAGLSTGTLPVWTDFDGQFVEIDPEKFFGRNMWNSTHTVLTGKYIPLNVWDDDLRRDFDRADLWICEGDLLAIRKHLLEHRSRHFDSELPQEWQDFAEHVFGTSTDRGVAVPPNSALGEWTLPEAIIWFASVDEAAVTEQRTSIDRYVGSRSNPWPAIRVGLNTAIAQRFCQCGSKPIDCWCEDDANKLLKAACVAGKIGVTGIPAEGGGRQVALPQAFRNAELIIEDGGALYREPKLGGAIIYRDLRFNEADCRQVANTQTEAEPVAPSPIRPLEKREVEEWYRSRVEEADQNGFTWSRAEDEAAGRLVGLTSKRVRELRSVMAKHWPEHGRPSDDQRAKKAAYLAR